MARPTINVGNEWQIFDNRQTITIFNDDGSSAVCNEAIQQPDMGGMDELGNDNWGQRGYTTWLVFVSTLPCGFLPAVNALVVNDRNQQYKITSITTRFFGHLLTLECEAIAGQIVENEQRPFIVCPGSTSTTTTTSTTTSTTPATTTTTTTTTTTSTTTTTLAPLVILPVNLPANNQWTIGQTYSVTFTVQP